MSMAKFNIEEMVERFRSIPYFMFLGTCVNWTKSMTAEERQEAISGCNQEIDEVKKDIEALEQGRLFCELDDEEAKKSCELHSSLNAYEAIRRAMMFPEIVNQEIEYISRSGDFDYEEDM